MTRKIINGMTEQACWDQWNNWIEAHRDTIEGEAKITQPLMPTVTDKGTSSNSFTMIVEYKEKPNGN
jgi:hypothetical protein